MLAGPATAAWTIAAAASHRVLMVRRVALTTGVRLPGGGDMMGKGVEMGWHEREDEVWFVSRLAFEGQGIPPLVILPVVCSVSFVEKHAFSFNSTGV